MLIESGFLWIVLSFINTITNLLLIPGISTYIVLIDNPSSLVSPSYTHTLYTINKINILLTAWHMIVDSVVIVHPK